MFSSGAVYVAHITETERGGKKGRTRFTGTVFQLSVLGELSVLGKLSILDTTANKILCFDFPQSHPGFCETVCFFLCFSQRLPLKPDGHKHVYLLSDFIEQVPPFLHGLSAHKSKS